MANESEFNLAEPFEIEEGSLDGLAPKYIFALGAEWQMFRRKLDAGKPFTTWCLQDNRERFVRMAEKKGRFVEDRQTGYAAWAEIWVGGHLH